MTKSTGKPTSSALTPGLRRYLYFTATVTGAAIMIVEILGAKMLAPYVGTSHFVWTAQIAVTLVALATGYAVGGWLVDRTPRLRWIYFGLLAAAVWLGLAGLACEPVAFSCLRFRLALGSLLAAMVLFFLPLALLAMVGPFFVRMLTDSVARVGQNVGRLTSLSTLGSVAGTVLIGYVMIPLLANSTTLWCTAGAVLLVSVVYFLGWERRLLAPAVMLALVAAGAGGLGATQKPFGHTQRMVEVYRRNSNFGLMQVMENETGTRRYYLNDLLTQNSYDPTTKQSVALFTHGLHQLARAYTPEIHHALCIGMGVGIVPMRLAQDGAEVDVVEINPAVVPLAEKYFGFVPQRVRLHIGDGRQFLNEATGSYDTVVLDAFLGEAPPAHLMTRETFQSVKRLLKPRGTLVINTFGEFTAGHDFLVKALARTLQSVFPSVRIHASGNGNVFFVAADVPNLAMSRAPDLATVPKSLREQADYLFASTRPVDATQGCLLTDDYNPGDFYDAANREDLRRRLALSYRGE